MSTKIYNAYRLKPGVKLWDFVRDIRARGEANAQEFLWGRFMELVRNKRFEENDETYTPRKASDYLYGQFKEAVQRGTWFCNFTTSVVFHENRGRYYMRVFDDDKHLAFLKSDPRVEDFHYQDQADKPEEIGNRAWNHRKKVWNEITEGDGQWDQLILEIVSIGSWWRINPAWREEWQEHWKKFLENIDEEREAYDADR